MIETRFTPGPWEVCKSGACPCKQIWSIPGDFPVATGNGVHVGAVHTHMADAPDLIYASLSDDVRKANVALIAAAPDLYAALQVAKSHLLTHFGQFGLSGDEIYVAVGTEIDAALAKARGEQ